MAVTRRTKRTVKRGAVSVRGDLYERLKNHVGQRAKGSRGRISKTVDRLVNEWLDKQQQEGN